MTEYVIDASVAMKWLLPEEGSEKARLRSARSSIGA
jgi:predicted nucleic acid-binding protein